MHAACARHDTVISSVSVSYYQDIVTSALMKWLHRGVHRQHSYAPQQAAQDRQLSQHAKCLAQAWLISELMVVIAIVVFC